MPPKSTLNYTLTNAEPTQQEVDASIIFTFGLGSGIRQVNCLLPSSSDSIVLHTKNKRAKASYHQDIIEQVTNRTQTPGKKHEIAQAVDNYLTTLSQDPEKNVMFFHSDKHGEIKKLDITGDYQKIKRYLSAAVESSLNKGHRTRTKRKFEKTASSPDPESDINTVTAMTDVQYEEFQKIFDQQIEEILREASSPIPPSQAANQQPPQLPIAGAIPITPIPTIPVMPMPAPPCITYISPIRQPTKPDLSCPETLGVQEETKSWTTFLASQSQSPLARS